MKIAVDFDGTCVTHDYPRVGTDIGAAPVLKRLVEAGHLLILFTMRGGKELQDAKDWFRRNGIPLYGVNEDPGQREWTSSPKAFANIYIDDAALGCPLVVPTSSYPPDYDCAIGRPFVDWKRVEGLLFGEPLNPCPDPVPGIKETPYDGS